MSAPISLFLPYVPAAARRLLHGRTGLDHPVSRNLEGCVMLADMSGFTALVERLAHSDPRRGAERLQGMINRCFGTLTALVEEAGGEVLKFPGDAALALWAGDAGGPPSLSALVHRATACGQGLCRAIEALPMSDGAVIRLRVAIGCGDLSSSIVGGVAGRWEFVVQGDAIETMGSLLKAARPSDVVLSRLAQQRVESVVTGRWRGDAFGVTGAHPVPAEPAPQLIVPDLPLPLLRAFVPRPVQARIDAGQAAWLAEFRTATVMFLNLGRPGPTADTLHRTMRDVQAAIGRYEGSVNQLVADDKGLTIVAGFGVALRTHKDDAARALKSAFEIRTRLGDAGVTVRIGVTTGRVFTGTRGGGSRLEFALIGMSVNLAARLSGIADDVLCDEATQFASSGEIDCDAAGAVPVKGVADPVRVYRPRSVKTRGTTAPAARDGVVGRAREFAALEQRLLRAKSGEGGAVFLEGEPGIGKSTLVGQLLARSTALGVSTLHGATDSIERATSYLAWRPIIGAIIGSTADAAALTNRLSELVGEAGCRYAPLLNPILPTPLADTAATTGLSAENRARLTRELFTDIVAAAGRAGPCLIVIEDVHWMDSASWDLADAVGDGALRVLLVMTSRIVSDPDKAQRRMKERPTTLTVQLEALDAGDIRAVICRRLGVAAMPDEVAAFIAHRAEGQPLFAEEIALALRDRGMIEIDDGACRLTVAVADLMSLPFPDTVNGVVADRIDRLPPQEQLTLKVASVLGRRFVLADLAEVHPLREPAAALGEQMSRIGRSGLIRWNNAGEACLFSHAVVQDVAYELVPFAQRRDLHRAAAEWIERSAGAGVAAAAPLLAHHWERAEVTDKAMQHLETASDRALNRDGANREAADFLTRLLALAARPSERAPEPVAVAGIGRLTAPAIEIARWEHMLAQALFRLGRHRPMLPHLARCLALLGQRLPASDAAMNFEFFRGVARRLAWPPRHPLRLQHPPQIRKALVAVVRTYETLGVASYYTGNVAEGRLALLRSVAWAERVGASGELSRAYSTFAIVMGVFHRPQLARRYVSLARSVAEEIGDEHARFVALGRGQLPLFITGDWHEAAASIDEAIALGPRVGDLHSQQVTQYQRARVRFNQGHFLPALEDFRDLLSQARDSQTAVNQTWALAGISETQFRLGRWDEAIATAEETLRLAATVETTDQNGPFQAYGVLAACWLRKSGLDRAREFIDRAMAAGRAGGRSSYAPQVGFAGVADVLLALGDGPAMDGWLKIMRVEGFFKPILRPWYLIYRARRDRQRRRHRAPIRRLRRAIVLAERMTLPYESGLARMELARSLPEDDRERVVQWERAREIFEQIGAVGEDPVRLQQVSTA